MADILSTQASLLCICSVLTKFPLSVCQLGIPFLPYRVVQVRLFQEPSILYQPTTILLAASLFHVPCHDHRHSSPQYMRWVHSALRSITLHIHVSQVLSGSLLESTAHQGPCLYHNVVFLPTVILITSISIRFPFLSDYDFNWFCAVFRYAVTLLILLFLYLFKYMTLYFHAHARAWRQARGCWAKPYWWWGYALIRPVQSYQDEVRVEYCVYSYPAPPSLAWERTRVCCTNVVRMLYICRSTIYAYHNHYRLLRTLPQSKSSPIGNRVVAPELLLCVCLL